MAALDPEQLRSGGEEAASAIAAADAEAADDDWASAEHGGLVHCAATGASHHIRDHAPRATQQAKLQALS
jgi:hypothetical protein